MPAQLYRIVLTRRVNHHAEPDEYDVCDIAKFHSLMKLGNVVSKLETWQCRSSLWMSKAVFGRLSFGLCKFCTMKDVERQQFGLGHFELGNLLVQTEIFEGRADLLALAKAG